MESQRMASAIDIAIDTWVQYPDPDEEITQHIIKTITEWRSMVLEPAPGFRLIASLRFIEKDLFSYFNDASHERVDHFWKLMGETTLNYHRKSMLDTIFRKKKITNRVEYEYAQDNIGHAQQSGRITKEQAVALGAWIWAYENRMAEM
jgi:hypothetical protein